MAATGLRVPGGTLRTTLPWLGGNPARIRKAACDRAPFEVTVRLSVLARSAAEARAAGRDMAEWRPT